MLVLGCVLVPVVVLVLGLILVQMLVLVIRRVGEKATEKSERRDEGLNARGYGRKRAGNWY